MALFTGQTYRPPEFPSFPKEAVRIPALSTDGPQQLTLYSSSKALTLQVESLRDKPRAYLLLPQEGLEPRSNKKL